MKRLTNCIFQIFLLLAFIAPVLAFGQSKSKQKAREDYFLKQRSYPFETVDRADRVKAIDATKRLLFKKRGEALVLAQQPEWRPIGPYNVGGRIRTIVHHPTQSGVLYIGAAAGGVWKTVDGGETWEPLFDFENALAFGALAIDPNNPDILYAGTGEPSSNVDAYLGNGVYKTTDAGENWKLIGLNQVGAFSKIYVHPLNSNLIYAGATKSGQGLHKSTDAGETWKRLYEGPVTDVSLNDENENELIIGVHGRGVFHTIDGGQTWTEKNYGLKDGIGRVSVQMSQVNKDTWYALMEIESIGEVYKTFNRGERWLVSRSQNPEIFGDPNYRTPQGWYDNFMMIHPYEDKYAFFGGIGLWRTSNWGDHWMQADNQEGGGEIHVDQHCGVFDPTDANIVYVGNDGGIYKSTNIGVTWHNINNDLQITQFYAMAVDHSRENRSYGGTQDNGTLGSLAEDSWSWVAGGDGFRVLVDPDNPNRIYGEQPNGLIWRRDLSTGEYWYNMTQGIPSGDAGLWNSPLAMDPNNTFALYHGRHALYASFDYAENWTVFADRRESQFSAIAVSPLDENTIFAGNSVGELLLTTDLGIQWHLTSEGTGLPTRFVTDICPSHFDENVVYVTYSGYGSPHIFKSEDKGFTWRNISENLPDVPCNAITIHPDNPKMLFVATDVGVFASFDGGNSWLPFGRGLPRSPVVDVDFHRNRLVMPDVVLRAATHGRSMWEVTVQDVDIDEPTITSPIGGEKFVSTTMQKILWYGFEPPVKIDVSYDDGVTWNPVASNVSGRAMLWKVPNHASLWARIRVSSETNPAQIKVSNSFAINLKQKGSVLFNTKVPYVPYGIAYDGDNSLWLSSFETNELYKLDKNDFTVRDKFILPGDSLYTDLCIDRDKKEIYLHRMFNTGGGGGHIFVVDFEGNLLRDFPSPAPRYPIGLELVDEMLIVGDRDGRQEIFTVDPITGVEYDRVENPCQVKYGPRGLCYDRERYLYQVCTYFPGGGELEDAYMIKIDKSKLGVEVDRMQLDDANGLINARGVDHDPATKDFWVTDYGGDIYKIAGFDVVLGAEDDFMRTEGAAIETDVYPNPASEFANVSFELKSKPAHVRVILSDVMGNSIRVPFDNTIGAGSPEIINLDTKNLSSGIYSITFYVDGRACTGKKFIVIN